MASAYNIHSVKGIMTLTELCELRQKSLAVCVFNLANMAI